jgi:hypothetical protein
MHSRVIPSARARHYEKSKERVGSNKMHGTIGREKNYKSTQGWAMVGKYWPRPNLEARTLVAAPRKEYYVINTVVRNNRVQLSRPAIRQTKKT